MLRIDDIKEKRSGSGEEIPERNTNTSYDFTKKHLFAQVEAGKMQEKIMAEVVSKIDISKLTIDEQLDLCRLLIKAGYITERLYRTKVKGSNAVQSYAVISKRSGSDNV